MFEGRVKFEQLDNSGPEGTATVSLRDVRESDLATFYAHQLDPEATRMAAFPSRDWDAFSAHWAKIMADGSSIIQTVVFDGHVAGNIGCWPDSGDWNVGYWIGREYWGKGIASAALSELLRTVTQRPLVARVAKHNIASIRVLEKCGFTIVGEDEFAHSDGAPGAEFVMRLQAPADLQPSALPD